MSSRKLVLVLALGGIGLACFFGWPAIDAPYSTGRVVNGKVTYCVERRMAATSTQCMVQLDSGFGTVAVNMPSGHPGQDLVLVETRARITQRTKYLVRSYGKL
jgi:hypothetical protein